MSTSFRVSLRFAWLRLCQNQPAYAQSKALAHTHSLTLTKKEYAAALVFNGLILKIHTNTLAHSHTFDMLSNTC